MLAWYLFDSVAPHLETDDQRFMVDKMKHPQNILTSWTGPQRLQDVGIKCTPVKGLAFSRENNNTKAAFEQQT
jgi:hypothetical protein